MKNITRNLPRSIKQSISLIAAVGAMACATSAVAGNLTVVVSTPEAGKGSMQVAVYTGEGNWLKKQTVGKMTKVEGDKVELVFSDLPDGEYALAIFHDVNDNKKMDSNMVGMPLEPYGFSNNAAGFMGPAKYEQAKFSVKGDTKHEVKLTK